MGGQWSVCVCVEGGDSACVRVFLYVFYNACINKFILRHVHVHAYLLFAGQIPCVFIDYIQYLGY